MRGAKVMHGKRAEPKASAKRWPLWFHGVHPGHHHANRELKHWFRSSNLLGVGALQFVLPWRIPTLLHVLLALEIENDLLAAVLPSLLGLERPRVHAAGFFLLAAVRMRTRLRFAAVRLH